MYADVFKILLKRNPAIPAQLEWKIQFWSEEWTWCLLEPYFYETET